MPRVAVLPTGTANLASILAGLERAGAEPRLVRSPEEVESAGRLVVPGVGAFAAAMSGIDRLGLREALRRRIDDGRPTLLICLGLQILAESSDESPEIAGLGILPLRAERFTGDVVVPQMGWNRIAPDAGCRLMRDGFGYFANSFRLTARPEGWNAAYAEHGGRFVAALERGPVLACQFHPELSGTWGRELLRRWLACAGREAAAC